MKINEQTILTVDPLSPADKAGLQPGDQVLSINGFPFVDSLDLLFYSAEDKIELEVSKSDSRKKVVSIDLAEGSHGIELGHIRPRACGNKCIFCFVDQLPPGMRKELFFKDEDYRYSFLEGNYVTLSNIDDEDLERIIRLRLSPLYISIHATDEKIRKVMLGNDRSRPVLPILKLLAENRIRIHGQIVICPQINDGNVLEDTLSDLLEMQPGLKSIALVPVGITDWRNKVKPVKPVSPEQSGEIVSMFLKLRRQLNSAHGECIVHLADEFWLLAGRPVPASSNYGDFDQLENGVGMLAKFRDEFNKIKRRKIRKAAYPEPVSVISGRSPEKHVSNFLEYLNNKTGAKIRHHVINRPYMGRSITVSGLILGRDIREYVDRNKIKGILMLPDVMVNTDRLEFLDGISVEQLSCKMGLRIELFNSTPIGFWEELIRIAKET